MYDLCLIVGAGLYGALYARYQELAKQQGNVIFGGRLAQYKYYDMDKVIRAALEDLKKEGIIK